MTCLSKSLSNFAKWTKLQSKLHYYTLLSQTYTNFNLIHNNTEIFKKTKTQISQMPQLNLRILEEHRHKHTIYKYYIVQNEQKNSNKLLV